MDPKEQAEEKFQKIISTLKLNHWKLTLEFCDNGSYDETDYGITNAAAHINATYLEATIKLFPSFLKKNEGEQELILIHELIHCIIEPFKDIIFELDSETNHSVLNEQITSHLSHIINNLMETK